MAILVASHTPGDPALCKPQEERALSLRIPPGVTSHHWKPPLTSSHLPGSVSPYSVKPAHLHPVRLFPNIIFLDNVKQKCRASSHKR